MGDVNGDGRMELVCVQADGGIDDRYVPHQVTCVTVFSVTGEMLWQVGQPQGEPGGFGSDFPVQIFDIDGDGRLEVLVVMDKTFRQLDGTTGAVKREFPLPDPMAHDCILIANLTGNPTARDVVLKDRYHGMWAMDQNFRLLWKHHGNIGHFPLVYDINGDGRDEVMAGYDMLSSEGKILWSCRDLEDHADCLWIGDVNGDGKPEICVGGSVTCLYDREGRELWRYEGSVESQHVALGKFIPGNPGLQVAGLAPAEEESGAVRYIDDAHIDVELEAALPDSYVSQQAERLKLYRELDSAKDEEALQAFAARLADRFGPLPRPAQELLDVVRLRWEAIRLGMERVKVKNGLMIVHFVGEEDSPYYKSDTFMELLKRVTQHPERFVLKQHNNRLAMTVRNIKDVEAAYKTLREL